LIKIQLNRNPGEAQAAESVGDELEIIKANGFAEGKPIARQTLATVMMEPSKRLEEKYIANPPS
jgi:hypothetical protein